MGRSGSDVLCGFGGRDRLHGGRGNDVLLGGEGHDVLYPGAGSDRVLGGPGSDLLFSVDGRRDAVDGGAGSDRARLDERRDRTRSVEGRFPSRPGPHPVILAAGDVADCNAFGARWTAPLLEAYPAATVAVLGDAAYPNGTPEEFARCYAPTWGKARRRTRPAIGNHEYRTPGAAGYFSYFGARAGPRETGYYSYDLGSWHVVVLNSNCELVPGGGCAAGSAQERWLRSELAKSRRACTLAYAHHPFFSSGMHGSTPQLRGLWNALHAGGADLVLTAHDHDYERFAPQSATGVDRSRGVRQIVVGTGGAPTRPFVGALPASEVRRTGVLGVLRLTLAPGRYAWRFIPEAGAGFVDAGSARCH